MDNKELALELAGIARDLNCKDVMVIDLRGKSPATDFFVIATSTSSRQSRTDSQTFLVVFGNICGSNSWNDPWIAKLYTTIMPKTNFQINGREDGLVAVSLDPMGANSGSHDIEV